MRTVLLSSAAVLGAALAAGGSARAADHREAPLIREDATADLNDIYVFRNPNDHTRIVFALTVNAFSAPSENVTYAFSPNVRYTFQIDDDGDARADSKIRVTFSDPALGPQEMRVRLGGLDFSGPVTMPTEEPEPNEPIIIDGPHDIQAYAGQRDDPFFFDVVGFSRVLSGTGGFTGADGFSGFNVSAIVVEVPARLFLDADDCHFQAWGTTERRLLTLRRSNIGRLEQSFGPWRQIERMGNPAVNTALVPLELKDFYNIGTPENDAEDFAGTLVASLQALGTNDDNIGVLASVAVPDTLKVSIDQETAYPNGRGLADDVVDTLFFFIFNQNGTTDLVGANDRAFMDAFPYLAPPHQPK